MFIKHGFASSVTKWLVRPFSGAAVPVEICLHCILVKSESKQFIKRNLQCIQQENQFNILGGKRGLGTEAEPQPNPAEVREVSWRASQLLSPYEKPSYQDVTGLCLVSSRLKGDFVLEGSRDGLRPTQMVTGLSNIPQGPGLLCARPYSCASRMGCCIYSNPG